MLKKIQSLGAISLVLAGMLLGILLVLTIPLVWANDNDNSILARLKRLEDKLKYYEERVTITQDDRTVRIVKSDGSVAMQVTNTGNVGIGTANPQTKLDINGSTDKNDAMLTITNNYVHGNAYLLFKSTVSDSKTWQLGNWEWSNGEFFITEGGKHHIVILPTSGYVGIGTENPQAPLHVIGQIKTGDILFEKDGNTLWRMFEDENGLYLQNMKTKKVYTFVLQEVQK